jgi:mannose-6-phosphate isomerase-like protein (cupin superfamily)
MERRHFLQATALIPTLGLGPLSFMSQNSPIDSNMNPVKHFVLPSQPPLEHNGGMDIRVWVKNSATNGLYSSVECAVAPKLMGPAPHAHKELDELMYVLEGTASVLVGDEIVHINAGGWHMRPRMIKHTFFNASDKPLRFFDMYFNQPFEEYLEAIFHQLTPENGYPSNSEKKGQEIKRLSEKFGLIRFDNAQDQKNQIIKEFGLRDL